MTATPGGKAKFASLLLLFQCILLILFVVFIDYGKELLPSDVPQTGHVDQNSETAVFQDVHLVTFLGFGLLMTFLRRYCHGSFSHSFLIAAVVVQWASLLQGFFEMEKSKVHLKMSRIISADYAAVTVLVTFGSVAGKVNSIQLLTIGLVETLLFAVNEGVALTKLFVTDGGKSMLVHLFGAVYGTVLAKFVSSKAIARSECYQSSYQSDMFALIGTVLLWVYWPSFNANGAQGAELQRSIIHTYYAMAASCVATVAFSILSSPESKLNMILIQNGSLSGGIAIAAISQLVLQPWGAALIGIVAALLSTVGYRYIQPRLLRRFNIHDSRGVIATHALPAILGAAASVITAALSKFSTYKSSLYRLYPARAPVFNTTAYRELRRFAPDIPAGMGRSGPTQAGFQAIGFVMTVLIAGIGGLLTGLVVRQNFFDPVTEEDAFDDGGDWEEAILLNEDFEYDESTKPISNHSDVIGEPV